MTPKNRPFYDAMVDARAAQRSADAAAKQKRAEARAEAKERRELKKAIASRAKIKSKKVKPPKEKPVVINIGGTYDDSEVLKEYAAFTKDRSWRALTFIHDVVGGTEDKREFEDACRKLVSYVVYFPDEFLKNKAQIADDVHRIYGSDVASARRDSFLKFMLPKFKKLATPLEIHINEPKQAGPALTTPQSDHPHLEALDGRELKLAFSDLVKLAKETTELRSAYKGFKPEVPAS